MNPFRAIAAAVIRSARMVQRRYRLAGMNEWTSTPYFRDYGVRIGEGCRIFSRNPTDTFGSEPHLVRLGDRVTVTAGVRFITHDGGTWIFREEDPDFDVFAPIEVKDNVFIGTDAIIMPGVTIGPDAVVGANSVVTHDVPPGTVVAGAPARVIMTIEEYRERKLPQKVVVRGLSAEERRRVQMKLWEGRD
ncbi:MAG: acyltransferase [Candidatus Krumholzibacteriota bacterium]|nr:acyltransferase [Candidatus Krumholzibacteriota bacterium]